jgi:hypothetical protein
VAEDERVTGLPLCAPDPQVREVQPLAAEQLGVRGEANTAEQLAAGSGQTSQRVNNVPSQLGKVGVGG